MIERLLAAERALADGDLDRSARLFGQVADADPRNAIAVVGLAAVAERRGDPIAAAALVERALAIDPDDAAARRMRASLASPAEPKPAPVDVAPGPAIAAGEQVAEQTAQPIAEPRPSLLAWLRRLLRRR